MQNKSLHDIALRYCVDDLPGASIPHARLQKILNALQSGKWLTQVSLAFLRQRSLHALHHFAIGELPYDSFYELALAEQAVRIQAETAARQAHATEERIREAAREEKRQLAYVHATVARLARESDPAYQAKIKNQALRAKYSIRTFVKRQHLARLMSILKRVDADQRLDETDFVWLSTVGKDYFTDELRIAYHRLEADFLTSEFHKTRDPWNAVNASSHYRKCNRAHDADDLLSQINLERQLPKLQAALCTTHGGAIKDLKRWNEALRLGERAHALQPKDYRPCTLLGAIYMETGQYDLGKAWYDKAIERGATADDIDRDIRTILSRLPQSRQRKLKRFLLRADPTRWARIQKRRGSQHHRR